MNLDDQPEDETIIYPPPELKEVADKTAIAVAKNGPGFEDRLREKELHNPRFCFLNPNDPYYKYFSHRVKNAGKEEAEKKVAVAPIPEEEKVKPIPLPPPAHEYFIDIPSVSKQDLEIVKLTAQFVARNGTLFMTSVGQREQKNSQFDFMRPSHSLYGYFMKLVSQYTKILVPPKYLLNYLEINVTDRYKVLDRISKRLEFEAYVLSEKERVQQEVDEEKIAFATIDWHDFVVVETIEFSDADKQAVLPPSMLLSQLKSMTLEERRGLLSFDQPGDEEEEEMQMDEDVDMDMAVDEENIPSVQPAAPSAKPVFVPKGGRYAADPMQICPRCKANIKASEMAHHTKICLADPNAREKQQQIEAKKRDSNLVQGGDQIAENLKRMTNFRTDIFGDSNVSISQKLAFEMEKAKEIKESKVIWDGKIGSAPAAAAKMQQLQEKKQAPQATVKATIGPHVPGAIPPPPPSGPEVKKLKLDLNANALQITVILPSSETIFFEDLTPFWTVSQLKERLTGPSGLSLSKQKLMTSSGTVMRNAATLMEFGVKSGDILSLATKEKGGRK